MSEMTITIKLKRETEIHAKKQASESGLLLEDYLSSVVNEAVSQRELNGADITRQLDQVYETQSFKLENVFQNMQSSSLPFGEW